ncbi:serpin family protein [Amycolatopsis sp. YIM 10]|uniref:serpin family protein n=1 Tax=Amycolatopsis sp. YIM 10 TaxID=2653857 RepID=UPI0012902EEF|nr:serpin family protein [Amycolatopsis sp. YIM 10]QFU92765.1 Serpin (serine protease inhibitor) [Amycolatopsis sp. YIM 10]
MADPAEIQHLRFALALHNEAGTGDTCFSPYSAASALALVARAARGESAEELTRLLGEVDGAAKLLRDAAELHGPDHQDSPVLEVANTLWAWDELELRSEFVAELADWANGSVSSAPFVDDPEAARQTINADIATTTHDLIPELLTPGSVGPDTVAAVVNALYLKTAWTNPFGEGGTRPAAFHAPGGTVEVPTMHQTEQLAYAHTAGWQVVGLPAVGDVEAVVLLPDGELAEAEAELDAGKLAELLSAKQFTQVSLALPKLELDLRTDLTAVLKALGVRTLFTPVADLSGLSPDPRLLVSDVLHQAVLRIDESGLEGAAATAAMIRMVSLATGDPVPVTVDRPFLLLVRHTGTGAVYFLARVANPVGG